jgi:hypothetical protein
MRQFKGVLRRRESVSIYSTLKAFDTARVSSRERIIKIIMIMDRELP